MKRVRWLLSVVCLLLAATAVGAQGLSVVFLEGKASAGRNSKWTDLAVGGTVNPGATVRLPEGSLLRLRGMGTDLTLARAGTYSLSEVAFARMSAFIGGSGAMAANAARLIAFGAAAAQGPVLGAQSEDTSETTSPASPFEEGKELIRSAQYAKAVDKLNQALASAAGSQAAEIHYCLAYAYALDGRLPEAWKQASGLKPGKADPWAADFLLLRGKLLIETSAYGEAISLLTDASNGLSADATRAPVSSYMSALAYRGAGRDKEGALAFKQAAKLSPTSDLGRSAAILSNM